MVRVRFAPSPTGHLHIGSLRVALFNWLFARHNKGTYLLRIEDTDLERSLPAFTTSIISSLKVVNLLPEEPIIIQSERIEEHKRLIARLIEQGKAYYCYCPANVHEHEEQYFKYDGRCRTDKSPRGNRTAVVRLKIPLEQEFIEFDDLVRGPIRFEITQFDDFVIARSDGTPVYNLVVVADDADARITHVIRGEDHISNTPKQIMIYQAAGFPVPHFAHLPLILGPSGARLSKRDAATAVSDYIKAGYLPDALCNFLVRLGWSHGDQEIFSRQELIDYFTLDHVGKKSAIFDQAKLDWINGHYMRALQASDIIAYIKETLDAQIVEKFGMWSEQQLLSMLALYKERVATLGQLIETLQKIYEFQQSPSYPPLANNLEESWRDLVKQLADLKEWNSTTISTVVKEITKKYSIKLPELAQPIRLWLTGVTQSPGIYELMAALGKETVLKHLSSAIS